MGKIPQPDFDSGYADWPGSADYSDEVTEQDLDAIKKAVEPDLKDAKAEYLETPAW